MELLPAEDDPLSRCWKALLNKDATHFNELLSHLYKIATYGFPKEKHQIYEEVAYNWLMKQIEAIFSKPTTKCTKSLESSIQYTPAQLRAWLWKSIHHARIKMYQKAQKRALVDIEEANRDITLANHIHVEDDTQQLLAIVRAERNPMYRALLLATIEGVSEEELAEQFNQTEEQIRQKLYRARRKFQKRLESHQKQEGILS